MSLKSIVVDDSVIFRKVVRDCVHEIPGVDVVDVAKDGLTAVEKICRLRPDVVTLDVEMPGLNGLEVLKELVKKKIDTEVIMISSHTERGAAITTEALSLGAFDFITKPTHRDPNQNKAQLYRHLDRLLGVIKRQVRSRGNRKPSLVKLAASAKPTRPAVARRSGSPAKSISAVCIGISTGGPRALAHVLPKIPAGFGLPILVVQHMPPLFSQSLAASLDASSHLTVVEAEDGMPIRGGQVYIAPGGKQMRVCSRPGSSQIQITNDPPVRACRPSVDYLFDSAAQYYGKSLLGIIMTGMGDDGTQGAKQVAAKGGTIWAQDKVSSTVYGMPRAVADAGVVDEIMGLDQFAQRITALSRSR